MKTDLEIRIEGYRSLVKSLGEVDAQRFVALSIREHFDYTKWQRELWENEDIELLSKKANDFSDQNYNP